MLLLAAPCSCRMRSRVSPSAAALARNLEFQRTSIEQSPNYDHNSLRLTGHDSVNGTQFDGNQSTLLPFDDFRHRYSDARAPYLPATCGSISKAPMHSRERHPSLPCILNTATLNHRALERSVHSKHFSIAKNQQLVNVPEFYCETAESKRY